MSSEVKEPIESELDAQIAECSGAISRNPKDAKAYRQRGLLKARMRRYDDALNDFDNALRLSSNDANAFGLRALVWAKKGNRSRAIADFDEAIRLAPQNAELIRTHRQRVLSEIPREPVQGGDFNILKNPFVVLNLPPTAKPAAIKEAYEDAVEDGTVDANVLMRAQQTLLTPRLRTEAEVGGFLDVNPSLAAEIVSDIRCGIALREIEERLEKLHSLPRSNVIAHYGSARPLELDDLHGLIEAQATVAAGAVCDAINDVRQEIALGRVDREAVSEALSKLMDRQTKAVIETLGFEDDAVAVFDEFVSEIVTGGDSTTIFRLDVYVGMFRQTTASELSKRNEALAAACEDVKKNPRADPAYRKLESALNFSIALVRPIQTYEIYRQREDATTREMYGTVRALALHLSNESKQFEGAGRVVRIASENFGHLPLAAEQMAEDAKQLVELRNDQLAEKLLTPLFQACETANQSHRSIESEILKAGFNSGSVGSVKSLLGLFVKTVDSTAKLPFSDAPWRLVRGVAISLNNDSSSPRAADKLIQGLLDYATHRAPTAEMLSALQEDQRTVRKNQVENDLTKSLQGQKWKEAEQLADRLLTLETDDDNLKLVRSLRDDASAKRKAGTRVAWFWGIVIVGGGLWALVANSNGPQTTPYRSPASSSNTTAWPQTTTTPQTAPQTTIASPQGIDSPEAGESMPAVGTDLAFTRPNIRYCTFQRVRLEAARPASRGGVQEQGFNAAISDFNARCSSYRFRQSDKSAVEAEIAGKRYSLQGEGRALGDSWRTKAPSGARGNR
jgi:tetratricopeptide (TPR) repeat protein